MDEDKMTRWHNWAAGISLLIGIIVTAVELINNSLQRQFMCFLFAVALMILCYPFVPKWFTKWPMKWFKARQIPRPEQIIIALEIFLTSVFIYDAIYLSEWAGLGPQFVVPFVEPAKDLWDWLQLAGVLAVPVAVVVIGYFLQLREQERTAEQAKSEQARTNKQAETERKIAENRLQDQRLHSYLDRMSELFLEKGLGSTAGNHADKVKTVARARTLMTLRGLDGDRKGLLLKFLYESDLISGGETAVDLTSADLSGANLVEANLTGASLGWTHLEDAHLEEAFLGEANLTGTHLERASLEGANLMGANLEFANLAGAYLVEAYLEQAFLEDANLTGAHLEGANLEAAHLAGACLKGANLKGANLKRTNLVSVYMDEKTIMPDGSHYQPLTTPSGNKTNTKATSDTLDETP